MILKFLRRILFLRHRARQNGVKIAVLNVMLPHKYLDFLEVSTRAMMTPKQATSALSSLYRAGKLERIKGHPSAPPQERGRMVNKFCWRYRLAAPQKVVPTIEPGTGNLI